MKWFYSALAQATFSEFILGGTTLGVFGGAVIRESRLPHPLENSSQQISPDLMLLAAGLVVGFVVGIAFYALSRRATQ